ncbi:MAG: pilus assembly protein [Alphaproteobacteria bacterium]|nr:pilus assembly protein [Alphaproteobacteria bacterium]
MTMGNTVSSLFRPWRRMLASARGNATMEFAVAMPLLLLMLAVVIDLGRFAWEQAQLESTAQAAAHLHAQTAMPSEDAGYESLMRQRILQVSLKDCSKPGPEDGCLDAAGAGVVTETFITCDCFDAPAPSCTYGGTGQICPNGEPYRYFFNVGIRRPFRRLLDLDLLPLPAEVAAEARFRMQ